MVTFATDLSIRFKAEITYNLVILGESTFKIFFIIVGLSYTIVAFTTCYTAINMAVGSITAIMGEFRKLIAVEITFANSAFITTTGPHYPLTTESSN